MHIVISVPRRTARFRDAAPDWQALYDDLVERMAAAAAEINRSPDQPSGARMRVTGRDAAWREDLHPRADNGRFGKGSGEQTLSDSESPRPTSVVAKGAFAGLHELLSSGHAFSKEELMRIVGMEREKKFSDYMAMLKNPKYAGKLGALQIARTLDGLYRVVTSEGVPAPAPTPKPAAAPAAPPEVRAPEAPAKPSVKVPQFRTAAEASAFAVSSNLVDAADFGKMDPAFAGEVLQSVTDHLAEFPALRSRMGFVGSFQARATIDYADMLVTYERTHQKHYPNATPEESKRAAQRYVSKPKAKGNGWAWASQGIPGKRAPSVTFNEKHMGKGKAAQGFGASMESNVASKWHPVGCTTVKSIADHEYGHQLDFMLNLRAKPEIRDMYSEAMRLSADGVDLGEPSKGRAGSLAEIDRRAAAARNIGDNVSKYAGTNIQEFIAEAWAESVNNPQPRPFARKVAEFIRKEYALQHPS